MDKEIVRIENEWVSEYVSVYKERLETTEFRWCRCTETTYSDNPAIPHKLIYALSVEGFSPVKEGMYPEIDASLGVQHRYGYITSGLSGPYILLQRDKAMKDV